MFSSVPWLYLCFSSCIQSIPLLQCQLCQRRRVAVLIAICVCAVSCRPWLTPCFTRTAREERPQSGTTHRVPCHSHKRVTRLAAEVPPPRQEGQPWWSVVVGGCWLVVDWLLIGVLLILLKECLLSEADLSEILFGILRSTPACFFKTSFRQP